MRRRSPIPPDLRQPVLWKGYGTVRPTARAFGRAAPSRAQIAPTSDGALGQAKPSRTDRVTPRPYLGLSRAKETRGPEALHQGKAGVWELRCTTRVVRPDRPQCPGPTSMHSGTAARWVRITRYLMPTVRSSLLPGCSRARARCRIGDLRWVGSAHTRGHRRCGLLGPERSSTRYRWETTQQGESGDEPAAPVDAKEPGIPLL